MGQYYYDPESHFSTFQSRARPFSNLLTLSVLAHKHMCIQLFELIQLGEMKFHFKSIPMLCHQEDSVSCITWHLDILVFSPYSGRKITKLN